MNWDWQQPEISFENEWDAIKKILTVLLVDPWIWNVKFHARGIAAFIHTRISRVNWEWRCAGCKIIINIDGWEASLARKKQEECVIKKSRTGLIVLCFEKVKICACGASPSVQTFPNWNWNIPVKKRIVIKTIRLSGLNMLWFQAARFIYLFIYTKTPTGKLRPIVGKVKILRLRFSIRNSNLLSPVKWDSPFGPLSNYLIRTPYLKGVTHLLMTFQIYFSKKDALFTYELSKIQFEPVMMLFSSLNLSVIQYQ